ncbi:thiamine phosphate synthase [Synechococcus sp. CBW1002]|jgi:thiamine-phosphate pyrophosphorylase|uniref:thiamine phosphate synthase n=1 Tax=Synechococcus sp. CBW1002 TaxID=1353134 RepID=UPI0018CF72EE|nr:thiamine phosphate synthase [Synechococcus sp. CBW1002]QPN58633.1 thiamine phosphate synthase [Synechococcus sp. CBW1002]
MAGSPAPDQVAIHRLIDANLDRAREGLRVLEDWCRFALERGDLVVRTKDLRHRLGQRHADHYKLARRTATDPSTGLGHPAQEQRRTPDQVIGANAARVQEALRVIEEFARAGDPELAQDAAAIRYLLYDLEVELLQASEPTADPASATAPTPDAAASRRQRLAACNLYLVTAPVPDLAGVVEAALRGGVRLVQYRAKEGTPGLDDQRRLQEAQVLCDLCRQHGALFLVNDRIDLALAVEADGVHLGQGDLPVPLARRLLGPERLIGRSTHALEQLEQAVADGCDYVGVGPVMATPTKPGREPVGLAYVRQAAAQSSIPFFAIGGLTAEHLPAVLAAGARRVAVVRAVIEAEDPAAAARHLLDQLDVGGPADTHTHRVLKHQEIPA